MWTNELIFAMRVAFELLLVAGMLRFFGKSGLIATIIINMMLISTFGVKLVSYFGVTTNVGNIPYAAVFLAMSLLVEHYGKKEAYRAIWIGFFAVYFFVLMGQMNISYTRLGTQENIDAAMQTLFSLVPVITLGSMFAYLIAQSCGIWLHEVLKNIWRGKLLGIRTISNALVVQVIDTLIFFTIAFHEVPFSSTAITGLVIKIVFALVSLPLMYLSYPLKKLNEKDAG